MRLLTIFELASRSTTELQFIYRTMFNDIARSDLSKTDRIIGRIKAVYPETQSI